VIEGIAGELKIEVIAEEKRDAERWEGGDRKRVADCGDATTEGETSCTTRDLPPCGLAFF
jgi:hypothetical protein